MLHQLGMIHRSTRPCEQTCQEKSYADDLCSRIIRESAQYHLCVTVRLGTKQISCNDGSHGMCKNHHLFRLKPLPDICRDLYLIRQQIRSRVFKEKDGDRYLLSDQVQITAYIRERFQTEKVMIFAHSMGTIIARNLLCTQSHSYAKVVLSGFPNYPGTQIIRIGFFLTSLLTRARGPMYHSKLVQQLSVGNFNKQVKHAKTEADWICSDEQVVQAYLNPVFGIVDTNSDPSNIDFVIPANDDATKSIEVILDACCAAMQEGLEERKAEKVDMEAAGEAPANKGKKKATKARLDKSDEEAINAAKAAAVCLKEDEEA